MIIGDSVKTQPNQTNYLKGHEYIAYSLNICCIRLLPSATALGSMPWKDER